MKYMKQQLLKVENYFKIRYDYYYTSTKLSVAYKKYSFLIHKMIALQLIYIRK